MDEHNPPHLSDESDDDREDPVIPSNQLAAGDQSQSTNNNSQPPEEGSQEDAEKDDLENWGILTQYIGPSTKPKDHHHQDDDNNRKELAARKELDSFKQQYTQDSDLRDRARNHLESLNRAVQRGRMPKGLLVDIQPNCVCREDPTLKSKWAECKATAERGFTTILTEHLRKVAAETTDDLQRQANQSYRKIKKLQGGQPAKEMIESTLKCLEDDRKTRDEQQKKCRMEVQTEAKKAKKQKQ